MLVSRTGYSGELGYELYYPRDYASHVWDALTAAGATPAGLGALRSVRMEKRYPLYGLDVDEVTTPLEAGLAWAVDVDKRTPFVGQGTLLAQREAGIERQLAGIELADLSFVPTPGDVVRSTSGTISEASPLATGGTRSARPSRSPTFRPTSSPGAIACWSARRARPERSPRRRSTTRTEFGFEAEHSYASLWRNDRMKSRRARTPSTGIAL